MKRAELLERVRHAAVLARAIPEPITYGLGKGGFDPARHVPWNLSGECDCTGFLAWAMREPRQNESVPGGWIESSAVWRDATTTRKVFRTLGPGERPEAGDVLVTPDSGGREGHVAVISVIAPDGGPVRMVDCSPSNDRVGSAIAERLVPISFGRTAIVVRVRKLVA